MPASKQSKITVVSKYTRTRVYISQPKIDFKIPKYSFILSFIFLHLADPLSSVSTETTFNAVIGLFFNCKAHHSFYSVQSFIFSKTLLEI